MATHVRERGIRPQLVVCSPATRARQTLELVGEGLGPAPIEFDEAIYGADAEGLLERLRRVPAGVRSVLVVGHNPGFRDLALLLGGDESEIGKFPTGALASFEVPAWDELGPGAGRFAGIVKPKQLA
jgi:phosphohistidine phosphatase